MLAGDSNLRLTPVSSMAIAYILVETDPGREKDVYEALRNIPSVTDVTPLFAQYDLIAKITGADIEDIHAIILGSIRTIPGLVNTKTLAGAKL